MLRGTVLTSAAFCLCLPLGLQAADFSFEQVITKARERAESSYQPPRKCRVFCRS
jgi:glucans biosynthesis protein